MIQSSNLKEVFSALDRQIEAGGGRRIYLVVCGGTALAALGLVSRTTKDVDVLGSIEKGSLRKIDALPDWLSEAAMKVARDFNLPSEWLNLGPAAQLDSGLPKGLRGRLQKKVYGKYLAVFFISRVDQIYFKLYAALDRGGYHEEDLFHLKPSKRELLAASRWVLKQDVSAPFRETLISFLKRHEYDELTGRL